MSHAPATAPERYLDSVRRLAKILREAGAEPVIYATWAFRQGCGRLEKIGMDTLSMHAVMQESFLQAAEENGAVLANAGAAFSSRGFAAELYAPDGVHPGEAGSKLAAEVIAEAIRGCEKTGAGTENGTEKGEER